MESYIYIFMGALVINNFTLSYFLGLCPFFGVSGRVSTAFRLGLANIFVVIITAFCAWALNTYVLEHAPYLKIISYILVIASTVQFVEMVIKKLSPELFRALGIFLPLITTNCAILGLALFASLREYTLAEAVVFGMGAGVGFTMALVIMAGIREQLECADLPQAVRGIAITLITAGLMALAFMGFGGIIK